MVADTVLQVNIQWPTVVAVLSVPHLFYLWLWIKPEMWIRLCKANKLDPVSTLATNAAYLKFVQFAVFLAWYFSTAPPCDLLSLPILRLMLGTVLAIIGQVLNFGAMKAIGINGIYYGSRLSEEKLPWCTGFPFNTVSHPQYVGSVLSIVGVATLLATPEHIAGGLLNIIGCWVGFYFLTAMSEDKL